MRRVRAAAAAAAAAAKPPVRHFSRRNGSSKLTQSAPTPFPSLLSVSCTISAPLPVGSNDGGHDSRLLQSPHRLRVELSGAGFTNPSAADQLVQGEEGVLCTHTRTTHMYTHTHTLLTPYNELFQGPASHFSDLGRSCWSRSEEDIFFCVALWYFESNGTKNKTNKHKHKKNSQ